jgi:hypothetical protein
LKGMRKMTELSQMFLESISSVTAGANAPRGPLASFDVFVRGDLLLRLEIANGSDLHFGSESVKKDR